ncbi:hypothetical protein [Arcticibacter eurypsychrophilus]|uniref:hypothetical protein n=1 Tax=Arcticibacter eurypsychrophilus TaxID=1434752 RepID=UPI001112E711|nr:hypothetical protein [Arcticibacter eurypsychrophilus]
MNHLFKIFFTLIIALLLSGKQLVIAQNTANPQQDVIILDNNTPIKRNTSLNYIGEIKGRSYIKVVLNPSVVDDLKSNSSNNIILVKGTCYEAASGNTFIMDGDFNTQTRIWHLKCVNSKRQTIYTFQGRENYEGTIEGSFKARRGSLAFYLFKKDNYNSL